MNKVVFVAVVIVFVVAAVACSGDDITNVVESTEVSMQNTTAIEESELRVGEKRKIPETKLSSLKLELDSEGSHREYTVDNSLESDINWSKGVLLDDDLRAAREIACKLYQNKLNSENGSSRYVVEVAEFEKGDLEEFEAHAFYYVSNLGLLTVQLRLSVYDVEAEVEESKLIALTLRYDKEGKIVLVE